MRKTTVFPAIRSHGCPEQPFFPWSRILNWRACSLLLLFVGAPAAAAERFQVTFGSVLPSWYGYAPAVSTTWSADAAKKPTAASDWTYRLDGRSYGGIAGYEELGGWSAEMDVTRRFAWNEGPAADYWGVNFALGYGNWPNLSTVRGGAPGYDARYGVGFGRVEAVLHSKRYGLSLQGGVKLPFYAGGYVETSQAAADNPGRLSRPDYSLYAAIGYDAGSDWKLGGYFDSYFNQADLGPLAIGGSGYQLKNRQNTVGFYLNYRF